MNTILKAVVTPVIKMSDDKFSSLALLIGDTILANSATYPSVDPKAADGIVIFQDLKDAIKKAETRDTAAIGNKRSLRTTANNVIRAWAAQVTFDANGDVSLITKVYFPVNKQRTPVENLAIPAAPRVAEGNKSGSAALRTGGIYGATAYQFRYTDKDPKVATDADYVTLTPCGTKALTENQLKGTTYFYSCRAIGTKSASGWSDPTMFMVR
jgi:hypothetical protein